MRFFFLLVVSGYQNCCSDRGIYHQKSVKHLTFSVLLMEPFMNIGEFAVSHGETLISGDLTAFRVIDPFALKRLPCTIVEGNCKCERVGLHSFACCFRSCLIFDC